MKALTFSRFGGPEVLEWTDAPDPAVGPGQALVRMKAIGVNYADVYRRRGDYHLVGSPPWIAGYEGAGVVEAVGEGVTDIMIGDRVGFADSPFANAELVSVAHDHLIVLPEAISFDQAAAVLLQGLTAQYLIADSFSLQSGQTVVIHAAAGGVGLLLCQMARARGARVFAVASTPEKRAVALKAGAEAAAGDDWRAVLAGFASDGADVVYDSVGSTLPDSLAAARVGGTVVFYGFAGGSPDAVDPRILMDRSLTLVGGDLWNVLTSADARRSRAAALFDQVAAGAIEPRIAARLPLADGAEAHRLLESRGVIGKILLIPPSGQS